MILSIIFSITITQRVHYMKVIQVTRRTVLDKNTVSRRTIPVTLLLKITILLFRI